MLGTLKTLCALPGVSGDEGAVREYVINRVRDVAGDIRTDAMGNVIVFKKGAMTPDTRILLAAHMDEVGVVITDIMDEGLLRFAMAGGVDRRVVIGKSVTIGEKRVFGVISQRALHLVKRDEREKAPKMEDLYIDIGAKDKEEALKLVARGDTGAFDDSFIEFGDGFVRAKAIDDRFGCAVLIKLIESDLPVDCTFAFTVQEEVGTRGAFTASYGAAPDVALIVEGTTAADLPSVTGVKRVCAPGKGAVIPFMDGGAIYDRGLYRLLTELAERNNIPWQTKTYIAGGTDGQAVQRSRAGVRTAAIAAPVRNLHSPSCVCKISDLEAVYSLAQLFIEEQGRGK